MHEKKQDFVIFFIFVIATILRRATADCNLDFTNKELEKNLPIPLQIDTEPKVAETTAGKLLLKEHGKVSLFCSGLRNSFKDWTDSLVTGKCIKQQEIEIFNKPVSFKNIKCKNIVSGEVKSTTNSCGNFQGSYSYIGYKVPTGTVSFKWITLITVCYKSKNGNTLYTKHTIDGGAIKFASKSCHRPEFSEAGQADINAKIAYKAIEQTKKFKEILDSEVLAKKYINSTSFFARGHLSPHADFILATQQYTTYFYINAAPQWQNFNNGNWKSVEYTVREMSVSYGTLEIYTGTFGILTCNDVHNNPKEIFLGTGRKLPVPKYFWKIAYEPRTRRAIVFIGLNDLEAVPDVFCNNICKTEGYLKDQWTKKTKGYTFCCSYSDFLNTVKTGPSLTVVDILKYPYSGRGQKRPHLEHDCA